MNDDGVHSCGCTFSHSFPLHGNGNTSSMSKCGSNRRKSNDTHWMVSDFCIDRHVHVRTSILFVVMRAKMKKKLTKQKPTTHTHMMKLIYTGLFPNLFPHLLQRIKTSAFCSYSRRFSRSIAAIFVCFEISILLDFSQFVFCIVQFIKFKSKSVIIHFEKFLFASIRQFCSTILR